MIAQIILFLLILTFLVFIHELGHFLTALKFKIKVDEFGIGIPPRAWGKRIKGVLFSINWLPLGGFVRIKGEDFEGYDPNDDTNFMNKPPWQQAVVLTAGIFMNLLFALVAFYIVLAVSGFKSNPILLITDYEFRYGTTEELPNVVTFIENDSAADEAGIAFADRVIAGEYNGERTELVTVDDIRGFLVGKEGQQITLYTVNINTTEENVYDITPKYNEELEQAALGVNLSEAVQLSYQEPADKALAGVLHSANVFNYSMDVMGSLISRSVEEKNLEPVSQGVAGPVGIFGAVKAILDTGGPNMWIVILDLMAILSLSLAIMNLLPIPALDGGRLVFVIMEWVTGKRPSQKLESRAHQIGFMALIALLIVITFKDVVQLF